MTKSPYRRLSLEFLNLSLEFEHFEFSSTVSGVALNCLSFSLFHLQGSKNRPPSGHLRLKKSRLASEQILLADSLATESCRLANRLATKLFGGQRRCGPSVIAQGAWQSWSVQDARDLAPSIAMASIHLRGPGAFPEILLWRPSQLSGGNIVRVVTVSLSGTSVLCTSLFKFGFERRKCPNAWAETSFSRERPVKEEEKNNSKKKVRRRTEIKGASSKEEESSKEPV